MQKLSKEQQEQIDKAAKIMEEEVRSILMETATENVEEDLINSLRNLTEEPAKPRTLHDLMVIYARVISVGNSLLVNTAAQIATARKDREHGMEQAHLTVAEMAASIRFANAKYLGKEALTLPKTSPMYKYIYESMLGTVCPYVKEAEDELDDDSGEASSVPAEGAVPV
jgi:hypothetical protein